MRQMTPIEEACRKGLGLFPFHGPDNYLVGDGYYWASVREQHGKDAVTLMCMRLSEEGAKLNSSRERLFEEFKP